MLKKLRRRLMQTAAPVTAFDSDEMRRNIMPFYTSCFEAPIGILHKEESIEVVPPDLVGMRIVSRYTWHYAHVDVPGHQSYIERFVGDAMRAGCPIIIASG